MKNLNKVWAKIPKIVEHEINVTFISFLSSLIIYLESGELSVRTFVYTFLPTQLLSSFINIVKAYKVYRQNKLDKTKKVVKK